jgi:hypothetical protein
VLDEELGSLNLPLTNEPLDKDLVLSAVITSCSLPSVDMRVTLFFYGKSFRSVNFVLVVHEAVVWWYLCMCGARWICGGRAS